MYNWEIAISGPYYCFTVDLTGKTDMLTHLGPFASYGYSKTCGPDPTVSNFMT